MELVAQFQAQLEQHASKFGSDGLAHLRCTFPAAFPSEPPLLRLDRPILLKYTGGVEAGALHIPTLFREGWDAEAASMSSLMTWTKAALIKYGADVDMRTANAYPDEAFASAQNRLHSRISMVPLSRGTITGFDEPFLTISAARAEYFFEPDGFRVPAGFEQGNRVLVPADVFSSTARHMSSRAFVVEVIGHQLVRTYCGIAGAHHLSVEELGDLGKRIMIVPNKILHSLGSPDGAQITVRPVELPKLNFLQILPLSKTFSELDAPKEFLQMALAKYTCITAGEIVSFVEEDRDLSFYVTAMHPAVPAATVWTGDWEAKLTLDILPAQDDEEAAVEAGRGPLGPGAAGAAAGGRDPRALDWGAESGAGAGAAAAAAAGSRASRRGRRALGARPSIAGMGPEEDDDADADAGRGGGDAAVASPGTDQDVDDLLSAAAPISRSGSSSSRRSAAEERSGNAEFVAWRARQQALQDERDSDLLRSGVPVSGFDAEVAAGGRPGRVKVRTMPVPLSSDVIPADVVIRVTSLTAAQQLYSSVRGHCTPPGVPFFLCRASDGSVLPDGAATLKMLGVIGSALEQRILPGDECDACREEDRSSSSRPPAEARAPAAGGLGSTAGLPSALVKLRDDIQDLRAMAASSGEPAFWPCATCTCRMDWDVRRCTVCATGQRPDEAVAKVALTELAATLQEHFDAARAEHLDSDAPAIAAALSRAGSSGEALSAMPSMEFQGWMSDMDVDEDDLPHQLVTLRRQYRAIKDDCSAAVSRAPRHYLCQSCDLLNKWENFYCTGCHRTRPVIRLARRKLAQHAKQLLRQARRLHSSVVSQAALSLSRSASASGALSPLRSRSTGDSGSGEAAAAGEAAGTPTLGAAGTDLSTYIVLGGTVCLCAKHRCRWLDELYKTQQLDDADLANLTIDTVLEFREASMV